jgi:hypothetical protein
VSKNSQGSAVGQSRDTHGVFIYSKELILRVCVCVCACHVVAFYPMARKDRPLHQATSSLRKTVCVREPVCERDSVCVCLRERREIVCVCV